MYIIGGRRKAQRRKSQWRKAQWRKTQVEKSPLGENPSGEKPSIIKSDKNNVHIMKSLQKYWELRYMYFSQLIWPPSRVTMTTTGLGRIAITYTTVISNKLENLFDFKGVCSLWNHMPTHSFHIEEKLRRSVWASPPFLSGLIGNCFWPIIQMQICVHQIHTHDSKWV